MNLGFEKIKVYYDGEQDSKNEGKVIIEPLERGYARTLGNVLQSIMLTTIEGTSVIGIEMPNITSAYSSIVAAKTDMVELIINVKKLRFNKESPQIQMVTFEADKKGLYTADDLQLPEGVALLNGNLELIELTGDQKVTFTLYIQTGKGYVESTSHTELENKPTIIKVDSIFSPVHEVNYNVERVRIGQNANFERLVLSVETDGTITSKEVIAKAGSIASNQYNFYEQSETASQTEIFQEKKEEEDKIMDLPLEYLDLSVRAKNCLRRDGYVTVRKIYKLTEKELFAINQMGETSVKEVIAKMKELGLELKKV